MNINLLKDIERKIDQLGSKCGARNTTAAEEQEQLLLPANQAVPRWRRRPLLPTCSHQRQQKNKHRIRLTRYQHYGRGIYCFSSYYDYSFSKTHIFFRWDRFIFGHSQHSISSGQCSILHYFLRALFSPRFASIHPLCLFVYVFLSGFSLRLGWLLSAVRAELLVFLISGPWLLLF